MKMILGFLLALSIGAVCRLLRVPSLALHAILSALLVVPSSQMQSHRLQQFLDAVPANLYANANQQK